MTFTQEIDAYATTFMTSITLVGRIFLSFIFYSA